MAKWFHTLIEKGFLFFRLFSSSVVVLVVVTIAFDAHALRIVSLAPSITEILFALGAGDMVVADTIFSNYPPAAKRLPKVGSYAHPSLEKIVQLHPDYVIGMKEGPSLDVKIKLDELGIKNLFFSARNVSDIIHIIKTIAALVHKNPDALVNRIVSLYSHIPRPRATAVFLVSLKPLIAATNRTFINSIMACAGLKNLVKSNSLEFIIINREYLYQSDPDYIIVSMSVPHAKKMAQKILKDLHLKSRLLIVNPDIYNRPSYRITEACMDLRKRTK